MEKVTDLVYRLVLRARFESREELENALRGVERLGIEGMKVTVGIGKAGKEGALGLERLASSAMRVGFMFNMVESAYMRLTMGQLMVERGQDRLNKTIAKFGANSEEATQAASQLEMQMKYLNLANNRANVSMGLLLLQFAIQTRLLRSATLAKIGHTIATQAATAAHWLENAALKAKAVLLSIVSGGVAVPAMIGAGLATAGFIGGMALTQATAQPQPKSEINIETNFGLYTNLDEAFNEANRQATYELRRGG